MQEKTEKYNKHRQAMELAWWYVKNLNDSMSDALRTAWRIVNREKRKAKEKKKADELKNNEMQIRQKSIERWRNATSASPVSVGDFYHQNLILRD